MIESTKQNTVFLILKKKYYDEILKGIKKREYRDFTDFYISRFCKLDKNGAIVDLKKYKYVEFQNSYSKKLKMVVEIKQLGLEYDDYDEEKGEFINPVFVIDLGKVVETKE